jgi:SAM-dependent methyltransferase
MQLDAADLRDFYRRPLGVVVRRQLSNRIRHAWPNVRGKVVMGLGFATPYLGAFRSDAARIGALMPAAQGAVVWPSRAPCVSVLVEEEQLPLPDNSVDRMLVVHGLEAAERPRPFLREIWRVLAPEGRVMLLVPNRRGLWARFDRTPFGQGRPYSRSQLQSLLADSMFTMLTCTYALHTPPIDNRNLLRASGAFERIGQRVSPGIGGLMLVEAKKELMSPLVVKGRTVRALGGLVTVRGP